MIHLTEVLSRTNCNITEGSEYMWPCFGERVRALDFLHHTEDGVEIDVYAVFDPLTQQVFELEFSIYEDDHVYSRLWVDPAFRKAYKTEVKKREKELGYSIEQGKYVKSQKKILSIIDKKYPKKYKLTETQMELDDDVWISLAHMANDRNITITSLLHEALTVLVAEKTTVFSQPVSDCIPAEED